MCNRAFAIAADSLRRINADADNANVTRIKLRQPLLKTPQLGVA